MRTIKFLLFNINNTWKMSTITTSIITRTRIERTVINSLTQNGIGPHVRCYKHHRYNTRVHIQIQRNIFSIQRRPKINKSQIEWNHVHFVFIIFVLLSISFAALFIPFDWIDLRRSLFTKTKLSMKRNNPYHINFINICVVVASLLMFILIFIPKYLCYGMCKYIICFHPIEQKSFHLIRYTHANKQTNKYAQHAKIYFRWWI